MYVATLLGLLILAGQPAPPATAPQTDLRKLYEAGKYQQVVQDLPAAIAANESEKAQLQFIAAQSYQKLGQWDHVRSIYKGLSALGEQDPWRYIGQSAEAAIDKQPALALQAAQKAVMLAPENAYAYFQLGMAASVQPDFRKAADAFQKAALIDPTFAYAHYYAAMSYYKLKRIDLMATHFEAFLKLAPDAPEVPEVQSIMRTVRGG
ncbi:MAG TPA: hypothetical protein VNE16_06590 [Vicinamibacterales bacterium]|nr:hypothetical protein [Vicinamibacterales bacterium]